MTGSEGDKPPTKRRFVETGTCTYMVSVVAAGVAELVTYPLDLTKTRLQIQGEAATTKVQTKYRGFLATAYGIATEEGLFKLWQGISPAVYKHFVYSGVRITVYDYMRKEMGQAYSSKDVMPVWKSAICGISAGCVAQWLATPADLVKVQMQMEGRRRLLGEPQRYKNAGEAFIQILKNGGISGLWKGSVPGVQRAALVNLGDLTAYDTIKQTLMKKFDMPDSKLTHFIASFGAGFVAAVLGTPADTIKTRIMNQHIDETGKALYYKGTMDCIMQTVRKEGFAALYKGFVPCWIRMAPWAITFWVTFEQIRYFLGVRF